MQVSSGCSTRFGARSRIEPSIGGGGGSTQRELRNRRDESAQGSAQSHQKPLECRVLRKGRCGKPKANFELSTITISACARVEALKRCCTTLAALRIKLNLSPSSCCQSSGESMKFARVNASIKPASLLEMQISRASQGDNLQPT